MNIINRISKLRKSTIVILAILFTLLIGLLDYLTGAEVSASIFYIIPVALCAWYVDQWTGFLLAFFSAIVWDLADLLCAHSYRLLINPYGNTGIMIGFFASIAWMLSVLKKTIDRERTLAIGIQRSLLPKRMPKLPGYDIAVVWKPADHVSGDYYDAITLTENAVGLCIGDVTGHGMPAALLMSNLQAAFRILAADTHSPEEVCERLNTFIMKNSATEKFISFFYGILEAEERSFQYANAGHPPPVVLRRNGELHRLTAGGSLFGVTADFSCEHATVRLEKGDIIILYTDGIIEAPNTRGIHFGENRLIEACKRHGDGTANGLCRHILKSLADYSKDLHDDITLLVIVVK
jgi:serine phosphatase RsbU (regulator of sigma subunit)